MTETDFRLKTLAGYASRGAALLDAANPGWAEKVDTRSLDIYDISKCVLGQLYGEGYLEGIEALSDHMGVSWLDGEAQEDHGFDLLRQMWKTYGSEQAFIHLTNYWVMEIKSRIAE